MSTPLLFIGIALIFVALLATIAAFALSSGGETGMRRSLAVIEAMTGRTAEGLDEPEASFADRILIPLLGKAQSISRRFTPTDWSQQIREKLDRAGNPRGWTADRVASGKVVAFIAALVLSLILAMLMGLSFITTLLFVVGASYAGYMAPNLYLHQRAYDRAEQLQRDLPDAIDLLTISVESGLGFDAALAQVARNTDGPLADEFARILQEVQIGRGRSEALRSLADRTNLPDVRSFISALTQADAFGIPIGQVLRVQSHEIRVKRRQWAEEAAQKVPVKILIPLIFCILPCLFIAVLGPAGISIMENFAGKV